MTAPDGNICFDCVYRIDQSRAIRQAKSSEEWKCNFCNVTKEDVIVYGERALICDACLELCLEIANDPYNNGIS